MRELDTGFATHTDQETTTLCTVWKLSRTDGRVLGFTDHDRDIEVSGTIFLAASGMAEGVSDARVGFSSDTGVVQGMLTSDAITAADIVAGVYQDAVLDVYRVNTANTAEAVHLRSGRLGAIRQRGTSFEAEWVGHSTVLERSTGRVFSRMCDAEFGDTRCGLTRADFPDGTICPRSFEACRDQFTNTINFRGFPYLIGDDALSAAPQEGEVFDGGSRYV